MKQKFCFFVLLLGICIMALSSCKKKTNNDDFVLNVDKDLVGENVVIYITWDKYEYESDAQIIFPDGTKYDKSFENYYSVGGEICFRFNELKKGSYKIYLDNKDKLGKIKIETGVLK